MRKSHHLFPRLRIMKARSSIARNTPLRQAQLPNGLHQHRGLGASLRAESPKSDDDDGQGTLWASLAGKRLRHASLLRRLLSVDFDRSAVSIVCTPPETYGRSRTRGSAQLSTLRYSW